MSDGDICTWENCRAYATKKQIATDGEQWANLCDEHAKMLKEGVAGGNPAKIVYAWIKAQGGSKKATERM